MAVNVAGARQLYIRVRNPLLIYFGGHLSDLSFGRARVTALRSRAVRSTKARSRHIIVHSRREVNA